LLDYRLRSLAGEERIQDLPDVLRIPLSEPLFLLGALFVAVVFFVPGGLASLPSRIRLLAARRRAARVDEAAA
jgi:branched-chain amino acid transport system permease protein